MHPPVFAGMDEQGASACLGRQFMCHGHQRRQANAAAQQNHRTLGAAIQREPACRPGRVQHIAGLEPLVKPRRHDPVRQARFGGVFMFDGHPDAIGIPARD